MNKVGRHRLIGISLTIMTLLLAPVVKVTATIQTGRTFHLPENCRIITSDDRQANLADLKVGDHVHIRYRGVNGTLVADRVVTRSFAATPPSDSRKSVTKAPRPPKPGNENIRGTIIAINPANGTLTIASSSGRRAE